MENNPSTETPPVAKATALTIRQTLLRVCRHYQDPALGADCVSIAHYYEKQVEAIPLPSPE